MAMDMYVSHCLWLATMEILLKFLDLWCVNDVVVVAINLWVVVVRWWWWWLVL